MSYKKLQSLYQKFDKEFSTEQNFVGDFSEKALKIAIEINQKVDEIFKNRKNGDKKTEKHKFDTLKRLQSIKKCNTTGVLDIDELLDKIILKIEDILSLSIIDLGYKIYPQSCKNNQGEIGKSKNKSNGLNTANKYGELLRVLLDFDADIDMDNITIYEETLKGKDGNERKIPYKIIYLNFKGQNKTIVVSDEIGQATFIYDGLIKKELFAGNGKREELEGLKPLIISYSNNYQQDLKNIILYKQKNQIIEKSSEINIKNELIENYGLKTLFIYRDSLESIESELADKLNIYKFEGKYFFGDCNSKFSSVRVLGRSLKSFPNNKFNIENSIGNSRGEIESKEQLKEVFIMLGVDIVFDEKIVWRRNLESIEEEVKKDANVYKFDGKYFFGNAKGLPSFPKIKGKRIKSYPNGKFNRDHGIGDELGIITDIKNDVKKLYKVLGFDVIEDDKIVWKKQLESLEEELKEKSNIYKVDGKFFFGDGNVGFQLLKIDGQLLKTFPSTIFIKENKLGNNIGMLSKVEHLKALFRFLGIDIIDDYKVVWKKQLEEIEQSLKDEANIYKIDGKYFFGDANSGYLGVDIAGKKLASFPNAKIIGEEKISENSYISRVRYLKKLYKYLGIDYIEDDMIVWRQRIESIEKELQQQAKIYKVEGKYYFGEAKGYDSWPDINGKSLTAFPNAEFVRKHKIGTKKGNIYSKEDLRELFIVLFGEDKVI